MTQIQFENQKFFRLALNTQDHDQNSFAVPKAHTDQDLSSQNSKLKTQNTSNSNHRHLPNKQTKKKTK